MDPTFEQVWSLLQLLGDAQITSRRNTNYRVEASHINGQRVIIGFPRRGRVVVHEDCWRSGITCQNTRAGGLYNGENSLLDWYEHNHNRPNL